MKSAMGRLLIFSGLLLFTGCAALFGWKIHAPGLHSVSMHQRVEPIPARVGLYLEPETFQYQSRDRGGKLADPKIFYVGEAFAPMAVEVFQRGFDEFIFFETEPTPDMMKQYGVPYLAVVRIHNLGNRVTLKGQAVWLSTQTAVFDAELNRLGLYESSGTSDAQKVFAKKGGPEVNLNAAIENNLISVVQFLQDYIRSGAWPKTS